MVTPLNGTQTHPLSDHAQKVLRQIEQAPVPCSLINPGVVNRLLRTDYVEEAMLPSPFATRKGNIRHLRIKK